MERDLRDFTSENFKHKNRGQHPDAAQGREDIDIMGDTEAFMDDWPAEVPGNIFGEALVEDNP
eukprot:13025583-Heterocapsa_arctica.AAC.1